MGIRARDMEGSMLPLAPRVTATRKEAWDKPKDTESRETRVPLWLGKGHK